MIDASTEKCPIGQAYFLHRLEREQAMTEDAIGADMTNDPKLRESAISRSVDLAREAARHGGTPDAAWSMGEKLLTALVFQSAEQLASLGYSEEEAIDRLRYDYGASADEFPGILEQIRSEI